MKPEPLHEPKYLPLSIQDIRPKGWLRRQLHIQADGISGHLDEFWKDIQNSQWFGGQSESWERAPYWLDGVIPLAFLLDDPVLIDKVNKYVSYILDHQLEDGWLGPRAMVSADGAQVIPTYDLWAQFLILKVLVQYHDATGDERVPGAIERNLRCLERNLDRHSLFNWAQFRWFESLIAIYWLYDRQPQQWLLDLATKIQAQGFHYGEFFSHWCLQQPTPKGTWSFMSHVVNHAMAVKAHALVWRRDPDQAQIDYVTDIMQKQDEFHGMVTGIFSGDECLAGKSPITGTELCAVVEYAYSLEILLSILGNPSYGDRLEKVIYNALPATFSPDMWSHQYDQQVNQVECSIRPDRNWTSNGTESNIFGLEPNYGCCTANLSQGWPKFSAHLWMKTQDNGLAAMAYAPCDIHFSRPDANISIQVETEYPFREDIRVKIQTDAPVVFPIYIRIPGWTRQAKISCDGIMIDQVTPGTFLKIEREWQNNSEITIQFPMSIHIVNGYRGAISIERGPLVYSLKIAENWKRVNSDKPDRILPHADWEIYPAQAWNYAIKMNKDHDELDVQFEEQPFGEFPFSPDGAPIIARLKGRKVPEWEMQNGSAADVLDSPVESNEPLEEIILIPYGCTNLRITEFPFLKG